MLCLKAAAIHTPSRLHRLCIQSMNHCIWWMANLTLPRLYINWKMKWHELILTLTQDITSTNMHCWKVQSDNLTAGNSACEVLIQA
jgi:hypothetical protein